MSFGLFQREQRSLFGEILDWMLTPLLLLWPLSLALTWFVAQGIASKPFDRALEFNLQALTQFAVTRNDVVSFNLTPHARDLLRADDSDLVYYQLVDPRGESDLRQGVTLEVFGEGVSMGPLTPSMRRAPRRRSAKFPTHSSRSTAATVPRFARSVASTGRRLRR